MPHRHSPGLATLVLLLSTTASGTETPGGVQGDRSTASWVVAGEGRALQLSMVEGRSVSVRFRVLFGGLEHTWTQGPYTPEDPGSFSVAVEAPAAAWLDDQAADYLTDLLVVATSDAGSLVRAPPAFLTWPAGRAGTALVWDEAQAASLAPNGVLSPALREGMEGDVRIMPFVIGDRTALEDRP